MEYTILAIECSMCYCSVAIYKKNYIYSLSTKCDKQHTTKILPIIYKILINAKIKLKEINYIAFCKGPGNFTGTRIATGISQGFSCALNIPILGISTLSVMAQKAWRKYKTKNVLIAVNSTKKNFYWAQYVKNNKSFWIGENTETLLKKDEILKKIPYFSKKWTLIGNGWNYLHFKSNIHLNKVNILYPHAKDIIPLALWNIKNKKFLHYTKVQTKYLDNFFKNIF